MCELRRYQLIARNREDMRESYHIQSFNSADAAYDYAYARKQVFSEKGGWIIEVENTLTGQLVDDERLFEMA